MGSSQRLRRGVDTVSNDGTQQNVSSPSSSAGLGTVVEGVSAINSLNDISESASNSVNSGNNATVGGIDDGQAISEDNER